MGRHELARPLRGARRRARRTVETEEYFAMLGRLLVRLGERIGEDPAALALLPWLQQMQQDAVNLGYAQARDAGYGPAYITAVTGTSRQAVQQRITAGRQVRARIEAQAAAGGALVRIGDLRAEREARLAAAGVEDLREAR